MTDTIEYALLVLVLADTAFWIATLLGVRALQRLVAPIVSRLLPLVAALPPTPIPPGVFGQQQNALSQGAPPSAPIEVLRTKKGQPYYKDPITGMARFLPRGATSVPQLAAGPSDPAPAANGSGTDLNALARSFGYEPEQIAQMVGANASLIPPGSGPSLGGPSGGPTVSAGLGGLSDAQLAALTQRFMAGDIGAEDVMKNLPMIIGFLRKNWKAGPSSASPAVADSRDRW